MCNFNKKTNQEIIEYCNEQYQKAISHKDTEKGDMYYYTALAIAYTDIINFIKNEKGEHEKR